MAARAAAQPANNRHVRGFSASIGLSMVGVDARAGVVTPLAPPCAGPGHLMWQRVPQPVLAYPCALMAQFAKNVSPRHAFAI
ncbi:hypothetical protein D3C77_515400 [compost metagenome]